MTCYKEGLQTFSLLHIQCTNIEKKKLKTFTKAFILELFDGSLVLHHIS